MKTRWLLTAAVCTLLATSCGDHRKSADWRSSDDVHIAIDKTFQPIMEELLETFHMLHPEASMYPTFCSEDSALRLLVLDSVRACVATRQLTERELAVVASHNLQAMQSPIAYDAIAFIVNPATPDSLLTLTDIRGLVGGSITRWEQLSHGAQEGELSVVFDASGSSTVRYMRDSLCGGQDIQGNLYAQGSHQAVIDAVKADPMVIGVIGADWLRGDSPQALTDFSQLDVKVLGVSREDGDDAIGWKPYQYRIQTGDYPLYRTLYAITTEPRVRSNLKTFYFFIKGNKGQTIINSSSQMLTINRVQIKYVSVR